MCHPLSPSLSLSLALTFSHFERKETLVVDRRPGFLKVLRQGVGEVLQPQQRVLGRWPLVLFALQIRSMKPHDDKQNTSQAPFRSVTHITTKYVRGQHTPTHTRIRSATIQYLLLGGWQSMLSQVKSSQVKSREAKSRYDLSQVSLPLMTPSARGHREITAFMTLSPVLALALADLAVRNLLLIVSSPTRNTYTHALPSAWRVDINLHYNTVLHT